MKRRRKCNDEVYQLAKDQALVKKLKNKRFRPFCLCLPGRGTHWMTLADPKFISLTTIQVGKKIKDNEERVFGSASYKHYIRKA
jgi:hypothetical protein